MLTDLKHAEHDPVLLQADAACAQNSALSLSAKNTAALPAINHFKLSHYRNFKQISLDVEKAQFVILSGGNGAGKTNILEAVSMLHPGRGLRRAKLEEMIPCNAGEARDSGFTIHANYECHYGAISLGIGWNQRETKQRCRINGVDQKNQTMLGEYVSMVWLTPHMDRLFVESSSARRRFLDRLIYAFDPAHAGRINRYDHAMRSRLKLLGEHSLSSPHIHSWLDGLEQEMVGRASAIAAARVQMTARLNHACSEKRGPFPRASIALSGFLEEAYHHMTSAAIEDHYQATLKQQRSEDQRLGITHTGPHRSDMHAIHIDKNMQAHLCSTGEQKALLLSIILADVACQRAERGFAPLLILDEVAAHLDPKRRDALYELLCHEQGQIWMSGADPALFHSIDHGYLKSAIDSKHFCVDAGNIEPASLNL